MVNLEEKIVIFLDVLGFSNLTLENRLDIERIVDHEGPLDQFFIGIFDDDRKPNKVPVRAGIALGSFETLRFKTDIKLDSGEHASHFLGTGVVKAFQAESCGIKGMRVLIHPSIEPFFDKGFNTDIIIQDCESHEIDNTIGVSKELNYWAYNISDEKKAWRNFHEMWKNSPQKALIHYEATANSIQNMRIARGYPPIKNLKKVTISRK